MLGSPAVNPRQGYEGNVFMWSWEAQWDSGHIRCEPGWGRKATHGASWARGSLGKGLSPAADPKPGYVSLSSCPSWVLGCHWGHLPAEKRSCPHSWTTRPGRAAVQKPSVYKEWWVPGVWAGQRYNLLQYFYPHIQASLTPVYPLVSAGSKKLSLKGSHPEPSTPNKAMTLQIHSFCQLLGLFLALIVTCWPADL